MTPIPEIRRLSPDSYDSYLPSGTEAAVCLDIARRQQHGLAKYGTTVANFPLELRAWIQHAYEEALDLAVYLKRIQQELDKKS